MQVLGGQGVQIGRHIRQENKYIAQYIEHQDVHVPPAQVSWPVKVGAVPQPPPAFAPRQQLLAAVGRREPGGSVVQTVTGMRGVGKTEIAAAYARSKMADGWRLVAWVNAPT